MDLWWSMAAGRYILEHGSVPDRDVLSYTHAGAPWMNGEWLWHVVAFLLHDMGEWALVAFKVGLLLAVWGLAAYVGWLRSGSVFLAVASAILAACLSRPFLDVRAQLFLFLATLSLMALMERYRRGASITSMALLVPLMVLWVNWHYSFLFGIGAICLYVLGEGAKSRWNLPDGPMPLRRARWLAALGAAAILATLLNPYHVRALIEPFIILGSENAWRAEIIEWMRPELFVHDELNLNPGLFGWVLVGQLAVALLVLVRCRNRFDLVDGLLVGTTVVMALSARRFIPLFAIVGAPFLAKNVAALVHSWSPSWSAERELGTPVGQALAILLAWASIAVLGSRALPEARETFAPGVFEGMIQADYFPQGAGEFLRLNPLPARLYHPYTWGGYLAFVSPGRQMFIDGRAHSVYPYEFLVEQQKAERGEAEWSAVLDRHQVSLIVWPSGFASGYTLQALERFKASDRWVKVYEDGHSAVFAHRERASEWLRALASLSLQFPDRPGSQLFLAQVYLNARQFERARTVLQNVAAASLEARDATRQAEVGYERLARQNDRGDSWFGVGFYREVNGDAAGAREAYAEALRRALDAARTTYAQQALTRLGRT